MSIVIYFVSGLDWIFIVFGGILFFILFTHGYAGIIAASWVPTWGKDYGRIIKAFEGLQEGTVIDLGCGGGGVMRVLAREYPKARIIGYEISVPAWLIAQLLNGLLGLRRRCEVRWQNFYNVSLRDADAVYCFLTPMAMKKLKPKFERELKPSTIVISYAFQIHGWEGERLVQDSSVPIFRYILKYQRISK